MWGDDVLDAVSVERMYEEYCTTCVTNILQCMKLIKMTRVIATRDAKSDHEPYRYSGNWVVYEGA